MKYLDIILLSLISVTAQAQPVLPSGASNYASGPIRSITTTSGQKVTITKQGTAPGARPNNALGGVVNMPATPQNSPNWFFINYAAVMTPYRGSDQELITVSSDPGTLSKQTSGGGDFRTDCFASHMGRFDPIVFPGRNTAGHLHTFFGNSDLYGTINDQTIGNLNTFGRSTCAGGTLNRSGYWVPSLIDTRTGKPITPTLVRVYYKNESTYRDTHPLEVRPMPAGLRFISGSPASQVEQPGIIEWDCELNMAAGMEKHIPTADELAANPTWCAGTGSDEALTMHVHFPTCWDGVNLDSPGHQAHMAFEDYGTGCPSDHPVMLPEFEYKVDYSMAAIGGRASIPFLRVSSDNYALSLPGGMSGHGDLVVGWKRQALETWVNNCLHGQSDCHSNGLDSWDASPTHRLLSH